MLLLLAVLLALSGCGQREVVSAQPLAEQQAAEQPADWPVIFTDSTGAEVTLAAPPEMVAVLFSSYAEIWTLAGGTVSVTVGESVERGFAAEGAVLVDGGAGKSIDLEKLLAAKPDLIIGSADIAAQAEACRIMTEAGIPSALFRMDTFADYLSVLKICTDITKNDTAYAEHGAAVQTELEEVLASVQDYLAARPAKPEFLFIRAGSQYSSTKAKRAPENFVCGMLGELGAHNIADDAAVLLDGLSLEEILLRDPDCIFLTTMGSEEAAEAYISDLFAQDGWKDLRAVQSKNYAFLPKELFHFKPNARWAEAYGLLAELLYPELNWNA